MTGGAALFYFVRVEKNTNKLKIDRLTIKNKTHSFNIIYSLGYRDSSNLMSDNQGT